MFNKYPVFFLFGSDSYLRSLLEKEIEDISQIEIIQYEFFGIEESRSLHQKFSEYVSYKKNMYVFCIKKISIEAQHNLLKLTEELTGHTLIFSFPKDTRLIHTLLSRGMSYCENTSELYFQEIDYAIFLEENTYLERISIYEKQLKTCKELEPKIITRRIIEDLLIYVKIHSQNKNNIKILFDALSFLDGIKTSPKQIFEYIALMLKK